MRFAENDLDNRIPAGHAAFFNSFLYTRFGYTSLGVDCCHIRTWERVVDDTLYPVRPERLVSSNTGMMGVIPAWKLAEMFDMDLVKQKINEADALVQMEKRNSVGVTDIAMTGSGTSGDAVLRTMRNTPAAPRKTKAKKKTG